MTKGAHVKTVDVRMVIRWIVVPKLRIWAAIRWVRSESVMTAFTADTTLRADADIEAWVAAGATIGRLGVTRLAIEQAVREGRGQTFGGRAMIGWKKEAAIHSVG